MKLFNFLFPKKFQLMDNLLEELTSKYGVYNMDKWIPKIKFLLLFRNVNGLIKSTNKQYVNANGVDNSWTAGLQSVLALGSIANGKALTTLQKISNHDMAVCADYPNVATLVLITLLNQEEQKNENRVTSKQIVFDTYIDDRDGKSYKTVQIGSQIFMAENFAYKTNSGCWTLNNKSDNVSKYGYFYDWETAKSIAPKGWRLPTKRDFEELYAFLGGDNNKVYKSLAEHGSSGFNALFSGFCNSEGKFNEGGGAFFWSSTAYNDKNAYALSCFTFNEQAYIDTPSCCLGVNARLIKEDGVGS